MSEPEARVTGWIDLPGGACHGSVYDERIRFRSETYLLPVEEGTIWVDPLLPGPEATAAVGELAAVCLTGPVHQRAAWAVRRRWHVPVWAPRGSAAAMAEAPDVEFDDGDRLGGNLVTRVVVAPTQPHAILGWTDADGRRVWLVGDVVMRGDHGPLRLVPPDHQTDPAGLMATVRRLESLRPDAIYPAHGAPWLDGAAEEMANLRRRLEEG